MKFHPGLDMGFAKDHDRENLIDQRNAHEKDTGNTASYHRAFLKTIKTNTHLTPSGQKTLLIFM